MPLSARNEDARHRGRWAMTGAPRVPSRAKLRRGAIPSSGAAVGVAGASRWRLRGRARRDEAGTLLGRHAGPLTAHPDVGGRPRRAATCLEDNLPGRQVIGADRKTHPGEADATGAFRSSTASMGFGYMRRRRTSKVNTVRRHPLAARGIGRYVSRSDVTGGGPCSPRRRTGRTPLPRWRSRTPGC